jgi:hypothetical protein
MRNVRFAMTAVMIAGTLALSACGKKEEPIVSGAEDNIVTEMPIEDSPALNSVDVPAPANAAVNITNTVAPPPAFSDTEQMRDDADATGLTSRLPTDDAANEVQPVN